MLHLGNSPDGPHQLKTSRLTTHAVLLGMTGSGKTGLGIVLLEELCKQGIPIIAVDPKGDLGNLALLFEDLDPQAFEQWGGDAAGWKAGLSKWGLGVDDVNSLKSKMDLHLYTPGSGAGKAVDVLGAFRKPAGVDNEESLRRLAGTSAAGLLRLVNRGDDPVRDPEAIVLTQLIEAAWANGEDPTLETLILKLVDPPFAKVGVFPLDTFFPRADRMKVAMDLNGLLASPTFRAWTTGVPLDVASLLTPQPGKAPVHIFNIAHLSEAERHFFLAMLFGQMQAWSRAQPGADDLRAALFIDEAAGLMPPHPKSPATKEPLLMMMKQARAVGLGIVLATQDPVDLDHKAMSNAGLWFVGRLRTEQGRERVLQGTGDRELDGVLNGLEKRQFLTFDVKEDAPVVVQSRHAMCLLRGPLTTIEVERLVGARPAQAAPVATAAPESTGTAQPPPAPGDQWFLDPEVVFSSAMKDVFSEHAERAGEAIQFRPALVAEVRLRFDERNGFTLDEHHWRVFFPLRDRLPEAQMVGLQDRDLLTNTPQGIFEDLPSWVDDKAELKRARTAVFDEIYRGENRGMYVHAKLKLHGKAGESAEDFSDRCREAIEDRIDVAVAKLKDRYDREAKRVDDRIARKEQELSRLSSTVKGRQAEEVINLGETIWSMFSGRKRSLTSAMSKRRRTVEAKERVSNIDEQLKTLRAEAYEVATRLEDEIAEIERDQMALLDDIEEREVGLEKNDIEVVRFGVLWVPVSRPL